MLLALLGVALGAPTWDHTYAALDAFYAGAVQTDGVDYVLLGTREAQLTGWLDLAATAPVSTFTRDQALAFWIDAYNAITVSVVLDAGAINSIRDLDGGEVWKVRRFEIGGQTLTLDQIENQRIRSFGEPRIHAVVNCASKGCPPLPPRAVRADRLEADLEAGAKRWAASNAMRLDGDTVKLSQVFDWYSADFARYATSVPTIADPKVAGALGFLSAYVEPQTAAKLRGGALKPTWAPYDWSLNRR